MSRPVHFIKAFLSSALGTALSRVLGAVRDIVMASFLGAGSASDAFFVAFTVPNVFRRFVADEGLTGALIPALARAEAEEGEEAMRRVAASTLGALLLANAVLMVLGVLGAPYLVLAFAWSYQDDPAQYALTVTMTRWMFPFLTMVSLVSFFEGLLNYRGHFFTPKIAPAFVSGGIAGSAMLLGSRLGEPVYALVVGVLVGGLAHVLVNLPAVWSRWGRIQVAAHFSDPRLRAVLRELSKVVAIGVFAQINLVVLRQLATSLPAGSVTHYWNANRVVDLSQGVVAVAIGSALLPNVSAAVAAQAWDTFRADLVRALRLASFLLFPVAAVLITFAEPIISVLFRHGRYTAADMLTTADTLRWMVPYVLAVAALNIIKKVYFALDDRTTLIKIGAVGVALTGGLGAGLVGPLAVKGLALALSLATCAQLVLYLIVLRRRLGTRLGLGMLASPLFKICVALIPVALILVPAATLGEWSLGPSSPHNLMVFVVALVLSGLAYLGSTWAMGLEEVRVVTRRIAARVL